MTLNEFSLWVHSENGWGNEIANLAGINVSKDFPDLLNIPSSLKNSTFDWQKMMLIASVLSKSSERDDLEIALLIAQSGLQLSESKSVNNASLIVLNQLKNNRTALDLIKKQYGQGDYLSHLGLTARMMSFREEMESKIFSSFSSPISANRFQIDFWNSTGHNDWIYALAPTASGKSFIVLKYILEQIGLGKAKTVVYIAPTRALVSEIELNLRNAFQNAGIKDITVSSIPVKELINLSSPSVFVFTQERLHIFLNSINPDSSIDILVVDEIQKLGDGMRGVILQEAIERVLRINKSATILYLSPNAENPEYLFRDKPSEVKAKIVDRDQPMVSQNILWASQKGPESTNWKLELKYKDELVPIGDFNLVDRPTNIAKKMAFVAASLAGSSSGTMVYSNEPSEAEDIAELIAELIQVIPTEKLTSLSNLARDGVHKNFKLVNTALKGVAFHYGNMPSLLREEIESAFNSGDIKFLVCTSTLIEGVNLSCKTIIVHGPKKGRATPMLDQDFWNLAGRAGRWGKELQGNIVCIDPHVWKTQPPKRQKFVLKRKTDEVLQDNGLINYILSRDFDISSIDDSKHFEAVLAYLINSYIRDKGLSSEQFLNNYSEDYITSLQNSLANLSEQIDIPQSLVEKHSGISAVSMQSLLNYFRKSYSNDKKPISNLIPLTPETEGAYENMEGILRRIHKKLYPGFGFGYQYRHFAVLILNWMRGYPLTRLIQDAITYNKEQSEIKKKKPKGIHTIIRDTMTEVEEIARFKAPKYISCYTDILKLFLSEQNKLDLYPKEYPFDLFLEFGVMSKTLLSLIGLGLSRMTAVELGESMISTEMTKDECLKWIQENLLQKDLPEFVVKEVERKILTLSN